MAWHAFTKLLTNSIFSFACIVSTLFVSNSLLFIPAVGATDDQSGIPTIYGTEWGLTLNRAGDGFYNQIAQLLFPSVVNANRFKTIPYRRALMRFQLNGGSCVYPSALDFLHESNYVESKKAYVETVPFQYHLINIFPRPGTDIPTEKKHLANKLIGYAMGTRIQVYIDAPNTQFLPITDEIDKAEMLLGGRLDAITAAMPDAKFVFDRLGVPMPAFDPTFVIKKGRLRVVCHRTQETEKFVEQLNIRIKHLWLSKQYQAFMAEHGLDPTHYQPDWVRNISIDASNETAAPEHDDKSPS